jgi:hypothetical protein
MHSELSRKAFFKHKNIHVMQDGAHLLVRFTFSNFKTVVEQFEQPITASFSKEYNPI